MVGMVTITLNGEPCEVAADTNILTAAASRGVAIPHLCYHPGLSTSASCGLCLVEVGASEQRTVVKACDTPVTEGMIIRTETEELQRRRRPALDFLVASHQVDCPVCDKAGECELQEYVHAYGARLRPLTADERTGTPDLIVFGAHVGLNRRRCIGCGRCVRFCAEISGTHELQLFGRGKDVVAGATGPEVDNPLSGNLTDLCPAGALVDLHFRCMAPAWQLRGIDSICPGCATGCSIRVDVYRDRIVRLRPRVNPAVNRYWMCDRGRFGWEGVHAPQRLVVPSIRRESAAEPVNWPDAVAYVAGAINRRFGPGSVGLMASGHQTNEEIFVLGQLAEIWHSERVALRPADPSGADRCYGDGFTIRGDQRPNARGAAEVLVAMGVELLEADAMWAAMRDGSVRAALVLGGGAQVAPTPPEREALACLELLIVVDILPTPLAELAHVVLPGFSPWEKDGTFTNADGLVQQLQAAVSAPSGTASDWDILQQLARAHGAPWTYVHPRQIAVHVSRLLGKRHGQLWASRRAAGTASGQPFGGGWADWQRRNGLLQVADHTKRGAHGVR